MFRLQRLEITGFKSFADYTEIVFTGNGITAVVGPNGCGKSNVSESIAWVLGEQRAKALRGAEMKDVVFQGTRQRKPSGMAEVVLHFVRDEEDFFGGDEDDLSEIDEALGNLDENAVDVENLESDSQDPAIETVAPEMESSLQTLDRKLSTSDSTKRKRHWRPRNFVLDYAPGEAISVTRRLYLSGESEYLLNGKACRLRDIQDLFAGTGLSGAHYAIIEQGRIGQILSAKPADRRGLIEEAAGISKFRARQRAAETRLESAKTNLSRISDIVSEIDKQANSLRRQAAKTRRYKVLREEFRELLKKLFAAEGASLTETANALEIKLAAATEIERRLFAEVAAKDESFRNATAEARTAEELLAELRRTHSENALERDRASREYRYQTEQIENLTARSNILKGEIESIETRLKMLREEMSRLTEEEKKERTAAEKAELDLRAADQKYQQKIGELRRIEADIETERAELYRHTAAIERFAGIERQLENNFERLTERAEGLKRENTRAAETHHEQTAEAANLAAEIAIQHQRAAELHREKQNLQMLSTEARNLLKVAEDHLRTAKNDLSRRQNRLETLRELEEKRAVYAPQIQKMFAAESKIGVKFHGILADKFIVEERAERAIEMLFGNYLQSILVETEDAARKTLAYLHEHNFGRISLIVENQKSEVESQKPEKLKIQNPKLEAEYRIADLVGVSEVFAEILREVFPREMSAVVVTSLSDVKAQTSGIRIDFDGNIISDGKLFVGGKANANEKNTSLLAFKREMRELAAAAEKLDKEIESAEEQTAAARQNLAAHEEKIVDTNSLIIKIERELVGLETREKSIRQDIERAVRHQKIVAGESTQIENEIGEISGKQTDIKINAQKAREAKDESSKRLDEITKSLNAARRNADAENTDLNEKRTFAATSGERRRAAQNALRRVEGEEKEIIARLSSRDLEALEIENTVKGLQNSTDQISAKIAAAQDEQTSEQSALEAATESLKASRESADAMSAMLADLNKRAAESRNERAAFEIRHTETITKLRNINEKCSQELGASLVELVENTEIENEFDLENARTESEDLRDKLENFGAINMLALEELSESEERLTFLTQQRQDIVDSIEAAEAALREIKERSRERFKQAFAAINRNFIEFFQELFGGGRGEMMLLESADVLEAGIEIIAQPPGKRLQNMLLLSGGEKAMAALALVMAIFKYRPAPFCLLDEVDAPLDDANVGRFVNKIAQMSEKTQFIVITHNKRTMEAARALYGVTMQEAGVSKIVSVKFD